MSAPMYSVHWSEHQTSLTSALNDFRHNLSDVTLVCEDLQIPANKLVLSACSSFFYSLLKDCTFTPVIVFLPDTNPDHLVSLLSMLYTGKMTITKDDLEPVLATACELQLECFSVKTPESCLKVPPSCSQEEEGFEFFDSDWLSSYSEQSMWESDEMRYQKMLCDMIKTNLKTEAVGGGTNWHCLSCGKKWMENSTKDRRNAKRHMESHLHVRVQCGKCGSSFKTRESFWNSKCKGSSRKHNSDTGFIIVPSETIEVNKVGDSIVVKNSDDSLAKGKPSVENDIVDYTVEVNNNYMCDNTVKSEFEVNFEDQMKELVSLKMEKVNENWHCLVCGKFWVAKKQCSRHMQSHLVGITLPCEICDKIFASKRSLQSHMSRFHVN